MCHSTDSRAPAPPLVVPTDDHRAFDLTAADGAVSPSFEAYPATSTSSGVVILPDVRGAHAYYRDLAVRFAEAGYAAIVIDYYGRLTDDPGRDDDFNWQALFESVDPVWIERDVAAAIARLAERAITSVLTVGFCFGGAQSWRLASTALALSGAVGFYGPPRFVGDAVDAISKPVLMLLAGDDVATTPAEFETFTARLDATGTAYEQHTYPGAPHSFFDGAQTEFRDAADDAWRRVLSFLGRHHASPSADPRQPTLSRLDRIVPDLPGLADRLAHQTINNRPGLPRRDRELLILAMLIAIGDTGPQLQAHAQYAAAAGLSVDELREVVIQAVPYVGFPRAINAAFALEQHLATRESVG